MRIRLSITLDLDRRQTADEIPPHDVIEGGAHIERAPSRAVGFAPPDEEEGRR